MTVNNTCYNVYYDMGYMHPSLKKNYNIKKYVLHHVIIVKNIVIMNVFGPEVAGSCILTSVKVNHPSGRNAVHVDLQQSIWSARVIVPDISSLWSSRIIFHDISSYSRLGLSSMTSHHMVV